MRVQKTSVGFRLLQHGVVLSEVRRQPGPTHSVFDVLAALTAVFSPSGRIGLLGFAGGAMLAPARFLGVASRIESCDLDRRGYELFRRECPELNANLAWSEDDAERWLKGCGGSFDLLIDDLSIPLDGDVFKPECSWGSLPRLMKSRVRRGGVVLANQLRPFQWSWKAGMRAFERVFREIQVVHLDEFENRILIAGDRLPPVRDTSRHLRDKLTDLKSRQQGKVSVRTWQASGNGRNNWE